MDIRLLISGDAHLLLDTAPGVFDYPVNPAFAAEFLSDSRHHIAVCIDGGLIVGFASAVHYVHPDKPPELWINEVGVSPEYRRLGVARRLLEALFEAGREAGCAEAWVLTDRENTAAMSLYKAAGGTEAPRDQVMFAFRLRP